MNTPLKVSKLIYYGNIETGEIAEAKIKETHIVRGGTEFITDKGNFLANDNQSCYFMGINIFDTDRKHIIKTMNDYVWGMSEEALANFNSNK